MVAPQPNSSENHLSSITSNMAAEIYVAHRKSLREEVIYAAWDSYKCHKSPLGSQQWSMYHTGYYGDSEEMGHSIHWPIAFPIVLSFRMRTQVWYDNLLCMSQVSSSELNILTPVTPQWGHLRFTIQSCLYHMGDGPYSAGVFFLFFLFLLHPLDLQGNRVNHNYTFIFQHIE